MMKQEPHESRYQILLIWLHNFFVGDIVLEKKVGGPITHHKRASYDTLQDQKIDY